MHDLRSLFFNGAHGEISSNDCVDCVAEKLIFGIYVESRGKLNCGDEREKFDKFGYVNGSKSKLRWFGIIFRENVKFNTMMIGV